MKDRGEGLWVRSLSLMKIVPGAEHKMTTRHIHLCFSIGDVSRIRHLLEFMKTDIGRVETIPCNDNNNIFHR